MSAEWSRGKQSLRSFKVGFGEQVVVRCGVCRELPQRQGSSIGLRQGGGPIQRGGEIGDELRHSEGTEPKKTHGSGRRSCDRLVRGRRRQVHRRDSRRRPGRPERHGMMRPAILRPIDKRGHDRPWDDDRGCPQEQRALGSRCQPLGGGRRASVELGIELGPELVEDRRAPSIPLIDPPTTPGTDCDRCRSCEQTGSEKPTLQKIGERQLVVHDPGSYRLFDPPRVGMASGREPRVREQQV